MLTSAHRTKVRYLAVYTVVFLAVAVLAFWTFRSQGRTFIYYYAGQERDIPALHRASDRMKDLMERDLE